MLRSSATFHSSEPQRRTASLVFSSKTNWPVGFDRVVPVMDRLSRDDLADVVCHSLFGKCVDFCVGVFVFKILSGPSILTHIV